ncbi:endo-1,4-beta-xylanase [Deinococcus koreensis]|uniref:Beta-xylanase n=1 Tax=Deinococcus koreensis TaxID=2054903 RepID=A0A2K3USJ5_9DEIO|nr:endo-1,4-beta-xylanase [Deinococcus koreensis]PNY79503.1 hypothetical protein CVO96_18910 [Deinococcus koreensis]
MVTLSLLAPGSLAACSGPAADAPTAQSGAIGAEAAASIPAGGTDVLGADPAAAFARDSGPSLKIETVTVQGPGFTQARRITGTGPFATPYDEQLSATSRTPIAQDDVLLVQFWARSTSSAPARTEFVFEQAGEGYQKSVSVALSLTSQWTLYSVPFKAALAYPAGGGAARFRLGYPNQSFEVGGIVLKNYAKGQTVGALPFAGFSYAGREPDAPWRAAAAARIEKLRKADLQVRVQDATGAPIAGATVKLEMRRHAFPFGSEVAVERLFENSPDGQKYQQLIPTLFNRVVLGNALKWPVWEGGWPGSQRPDALKALQFFKAKGIPVRGHNLLWPCAEDYCLPTDVPPLFSNPAALRARIDQHFIDILGATKGQIVEWDVINEPSANKRLSQVLGEDEMAAQLRRAKQLDPAARMFINDYGNLGEGDLDVEFTRILKRMQALGAPLEGIGLQGHFGYQLTPPDELYRRLGEFGALGLPLAITEFDVNVPGEALQADYLRDFLTVAFSTPQVSSFMMWGFWEGQHWLPQAALYRQDWSIKPSGQAFKDLVFKRWWTNASGTSDAAGQYRTRGFLGDYRLTVTARGRTTTQAISLKKGMAPVIVRR